MYRNSLSRGAKWQAAAMRRILCVVAFLATALSVVPNYAETPEQFITRFSAEHNIDKARLQATLGQAERKQSILDAISRPAERRLKWHEYGAIFLKEDRIQRGAKFAEQYAEALARAEAKFGVPASIVTAIIGVETRYGNNMGSYRVIDALYTLAFHYPKRARFFRSELEHFLMLSEEAEIDPLQPKGSYAGAMGYGQFIPSSYRNFAIDFDGDSLADIWNNPVDAIGSVANYFAEHDWRPGEPVILVAEAPDGVDGRTLDQSKFNGSLKPSKRARDLVSLGLQRPDSLNTRQVFAPFAFQQKESVEYRLGLHNFYVITRYNHSRLYARAVYELSNAIAKLQSAQEIQTSKATTSANQAKTEKPCAELQAGQKHDTEQQMASGKEQAALLLKAGELLKAGDRH